MTYEDWDKWVESNWPDQDFTAWDRYDEWLRAHLRRKK